MSDDKNTAKFTEKTDIVLNDYHGDSWGHAVALLRSLTGMTPKTAKELIDSVNYGEGPQITLNTPGESEFLIHKQLMKIKSEFDRVGFDVTGLEHVQDIDPEHVQDIFFGSPSVEDDEEHQEDDSQSSAGDILHEACRDTLTAIRTAEIHEISRILRKAAHELIDIQTHGSYATANNIIKILEELSKQGKDT